MAARMWDEGEPEPRDRPAVVCDDGVTALWDESDWWHRMEFVKREGFVSGGETCMEWDTLLDSYGPLREATADEAATVMYRFPGQNLLESS